MNRFFSIARHKGGLFTMMACLLCLGSTVPGISTAANTKTLPFKVEKTDHGVTFRNRQTGKVLTRCAASLQKHHDLFIFGRWCRGSADDTLTYGAIDADDGQLILKPVYDRIETHYKDHALIVERDGLWGVMTWDGQKRLPIQYDGISASLSDPGMPWKIKRNEKYGIYNPSGNKIVVPLKFDWILLREGYVLAVNKSGKHGFEKKWRAYDYAGRPIPRVGAASHLAVWRDNGWLVIDRNHAVNHKGDVVIPKGRFDVVSPVGKHAIVGAKGRYGLIDHNGKIQLPLEYKRLVRFPHRDDWFRFMPQGGQHYGVVDASGTQILPPEWDGISLRKVSDPKTGEHKNYFLVKLGNKQGSLTLQGKTLISPTRLLTKFTRERPLYAVRDERGVGICNLASGKCPVEPQYDAIRLMDDSRVGAPLFVVEKDGLDGLINHQGHVFLKPEYKHIIKIQSGLSQKGLRILAGDGDEPQGVLLEFDGAKRQWRVARENIDMQKLLAAPYDGHGVAELEHPSIKARYLPVRYKDAARVVKGYLNGELRELSYPSLQLTANTAYIFFAGFASERRRLANTLPACQRSDGYTIVLDAPAGPSVDACSQADHSTDVLHFRYTDNNKGLSCAECAKLGVPTRWVESPAASTPAQGKLTTFDRNNT